MALKIDAWNVPFVQLSSANLWVIFFFAHAMGLERILPNLAKFVVTTRVRWVRSWSHLVSP